MDNQSVIVNRSKEYMNGTESLLTALNKFVQAVDSMDDTVMIPNRLKDMEVTSANRPEINEENNNRALLPTIKKGTDLYSFYALLKTVKTDLTVGSQRSAVFSEEEALDGETGNPEAESAKKTAATFRHHLSGIFRLLHQMTDTANYLTNRYESEVGGKSSKQPSISPFAI